MSDEPLAEISLADWHGEAKRLTRELAVVKEEAADLQSAIDTNVDTIRMMQAQRDEARADRDRLRALLRKTRPWVAPEPTRYGVPTDAALLAQIDAALKERP